MYPIDLVTVNKRVDRWRYEKKVPPRSGCKTPGALVSSAIVSESDGQNRLLRKRTETSLFSPFPEPFGALQHPFTSNI